jgi:hypothetical protein
MSTDPQRLERARRSQGSPVSEGSPDSGSASPGWKQAGRELTVAALLVLALAVAAWTVDGLGAAGLVVLACAAASLAGLRALIEPHEEPRDPQSSHELGPSRSFLGFWRTRSDLFDATSSLGAWEQALRPRLTNLLAARLSERHGISLADDPDAARALLEAGPRPRHDLWPWIDPRRSAIQDSASRPGIPPNVLAALVDRLEKL